VTLFWGGWLLPFENVGWMEPINFPGLFVIFQDLGWVVCI
jgi:hypothetical protein